MLFECGKIKMAYSVWITAYTKQILQKKKLIETYINILYIIIYIYT